MTEYRHKSGRPYQIEAGTYYHPDTPPGVIRALEAARRGGYTVRVFYGDTETGRAWREENDVYGKVGRSLGPVKVPLIVYPGADGGPAMLDHCIIAIRTSDGWAYRHPGFDPGAWSVREAGAYAEILVKEGDGESELYGREADAKRAERIAAFMEGKRLRK